GGENDVFAMAGDKAGGDVDRIAGDGGRQVRGEDQEEAAGIGAVVALDAEAAVDDLQGAGELGEKLGDDDGRGGGHRGCEGGWGRGAGCAESKDKNSRQQPTTGAPQGARYRSEWRTNHLLITGAV